MLDAAMQQITLLTRQLAWQLVKSSNWLVSESRFVAWILASRFERQIDQSVKI